MGIITILAMFGMLFQTPDWIITNSDGNTYNADKSFHLYETLVEIGETIDQAIMVLDDRADWQNPYTYEIRQRVTVVYPSEGVCPTSCYYWKRLSKYLYSGKILLAQNFTVSTLLHEYGHFIFMALYDWDADNMPEHGQYDQHWYSTPTDEGFALAEGWAEFFQCWVVDDALNLSAINISLETNNFVGDDVEGAVASLLWDLTDAVNSIDNSLGVDDEPTQDLSRRLWRVMTSQYPQSISEIRSQFYTRQSFKWSDLRTDNGRIGKSFYKTLRGVR